MEGRENGDTDFTKNKWNGYPGCTKYSISELSKTVQGAYGGQGFEYEYSGGRGLSDNLNEWLTSNGIEAR